MNDPDQTAPNRPSYKYGVSIMEYLGVLFDEWRTIALLLVILLALSAGYLMVAIPRYHSSGVIQLSNSDAAGAETLLSLAGVDERSPVETEVEILRSKRIVNKAVQALSLNIVETLPLFTFDFNVSLEGQSPVSEALKTVRKSIRSVRVADWVEHGVPAAISSGPGNSLVVKLGSAESPVTVAPGERFEQQGVSFDFRESGIEKIPNLEVQFLPDDLIGEQVLGHLSVRRITSGRKDTNLARVTYKSVDRTIARDLVNEVMNAYMSFALEWRTLRADRSASFIEGQLDALRRTLERSETELQRFVEQQGAVLLPDQAKELIHISSQMDLELRKVQIQEQLLSMVVSDLSRAQRNGRPVALTGDFLFDDALLSQAIGVLNELELKRETLLTDVTEVHPSTIRLNEEIDGVRDQILELVKASRNRIAERRTAISKSLDDIQSKLTSFPDKERQMVALRRSVEVTQDLYKFLMTKLEESRIVKASTTTDKRIIDKANTPYRRSEPRRNIVLITAGLLGLLFGVGAVFARRAIDPRIRDEEEVKSLTQLPVYGAIPDLRLVGISPQEAPILDSIWELPKGPAAESFRTIRTNVEFAQPGDQPIKVLQITSSEASEGKSTILANLGVALVNAGHKVLIVDLDMRRPSQHRMFGAPRVPGISECLVGRTESPLVHIEKYKLDLVTAGSEPPESQRLLSSKKLQALVTQWRAAYDYVLLDTPPLLVADSLVISPLSDMVLFVVRTHHCRRMNLKLAQNAYKKMEVIKGLVINSVATRRRGGYYHYYRGSYYGSKTSDTQES